MSKKLFHVNLEYDLVVVADDENEAERIAKSVMRDESAEATLVSATEMKNKSDIPPGGWEDNCIPWGSEDDDTIGQILEEE